MPYPMFRSAANQKPVISRPLPFRSYQDHDHDHEPSSSNWSVREGASERWQCHPSDCSDAHPLPSQHWPITLTTPTLPLKSPLRTRKFVRPNAPPALARNFHAATTADRDSSQHPGSATTPPLTAATTATTTTTSSSSPSTPIHAQTSSPVSAPPIDSHTTFADADPSFHKWLVATVRHQHHIHNSRRTASERPERDLPAPPTPPKDDDADDADNNEDDWHDAAVASHADSNNSSSSIQDYTNYLEQTSSSVPPPPPSSLSLCNSSGWSSVARRTVRSPVSF